MPITERPGYVPPGTQPYVPSYPIPPGYVPPPIVSPGTGASNLTPPGAGVSPGPQAQMQQGIPDNFFGFLMLLVGL